MQKLQTNAEFEICFRRSEIRNRWDEAERNRRLVLGTKRRNQLIAIVAAATLAELKLVIPIAARLP